MSVIEQSKLIAELREFDCDVDLTEDGLFVGLHGSASTFMVLQADEWIQIASGILEPEEVDSCARPVVLYEFLLRLQGRYLGCRFTLDDDSGLVIVSDIYPGTQGTTHLVSVMAQLDGVCGALSPLIRSTLRTGEMPSDSDVDAAFASS